MNNTYVDSMKKTVASFYEEMQKAKATIAKNNETYLPNIAEPENEKVRDDLRRKEMAAEREIEEIAQKALESVDRWNTLSGKEIDDADLKLLQGAFKLTHSDLEALIEKHRDNGTMIRAIGDYADAHKIAVIVPTPEAKKAAYSIVVGNAKSMLGNILANLTSNQYLGSGFSLETIMTSFFDPEQMIYNQKLAVLF